MRILEINTERTWRGGERQTIFCCQGFAAQGAMVTLLCLADSTLAVRAQENRIPTIQVRNQLAAAKVLTCRGRHFDILHAQTAKAQGLAVATKPFHRRPVVYTRRVDFVPKGWATRMKYSATDRIVAISGAIKTILSSWGIPNVVVIPSSVLPSPLVCSKSKAAPFDRSFPHKKIIATASALVPHKDPLTMVRAIANLRDLRGPDFVFLHYGDGVLYQKVKAEISRFDLHDCYRLMGFQDQIIPLFPFFHVFVMSSQEEGLGSSVLDAFLAGVPVVSTAAGGLKELVSGRGILCPVGHSDCLAQGIQTMLDKPEVALNFIQAAKVYVQMEHDLAAASQAYMTLFQDLLAAQKAKGHFAGP